MHDKKYSGASSPLIYIKRVIGRNTSVYIYSFLPWVGSSETWTQYRPGINHHQIRDRQYVVRIQEYRIRTIIQPHVPRRQESDFVVYSTTRKHLHGLFVFELNNMYRMIMCRGQLKCDGTRWRREGKWRGNWRMEWVASTLHTSSEHGVSSIITADAHTSAVPVVD